MTNDELPSGWCWSSAEELRTTDHYSLSIGPFGSNLKVSDYRGEGVPLVFVREIRSKDFGGDKTKFVTSEKAEELRAHSVSGGDLLITKMGDPPGDVAIYPVDAPDAIITADCIKLTANPKLAHTSFLAYAVECPQTKSRLEEITAGVAQQKISLQRFRDFPLPLAPLAEQKRIADKLEAVLGRVDACRARLDRVPALLKRFRQSVLAAATSGKLTEEWRMTNGVNDEWENTNLFGICSSISDGDHLPPPQTTTGIPFLTIGNISSGRLNFTNVRYVPESYFENIRATRVPKPGDTLYSVVGASIGIPVIVDVDRKFCFQRHIAILKPSEGTSPGFLHLLMGSPEVFREAWSRTTGTAQPTLPLGALRTIPVSVPTLPEQQEIVRRVEALFAFADRIEARLATAQQTVESLTPATLAKAFRGELVPQDPNDEPAAALLARLRHAQDSTPAKPARGKRLRTSEPKALDCGSPLPLSLPQPAAERKAGRPAPPKRQQAAAVQVVPPPTRPDDLDKGDLMSLLREVLSEHGPCDREALIKHAATALGFQRVRSNLSDSLGNAIRTAVRRQVILNDGNQYRFNRAGIADFDMEFLKTQFLAAISEHGRVWIERDEAVRSFARWLGFRRTGKVIDGIARQLISRLLRARRLEAQGDAIRRI